MFTDQQKKDLAAPLDRSNVKSRKQGKGNVSYIEAWHTIDEANRIFGFDGWSRETIEIKCVSEKERMIGKSDTFAGYPGWGVSYVAKVRTHVGEVIREGCGAGHGIDRDLGQAHESAIKEAETDAMKRALMTFGNQFGLALYDKEQTNVADGNGHAEPARQTISQRAMPTGPVIASWSPEDEEKKVAAIIRGIQACVTITDVDAFGKQPEAVSVYARCSEAGKSKIKNALRTQRDKIAPPSVAGAA
jgi:DNA recombination protein Rad52